jgi:hypothetical protein
MGWVRSVSPHFVIGHCGASRTNQNDMDRYFWHTGRAPKRGRHLPEITVENHENESPCSSDVVSRLLFRRDVGDVISVAIDC